jgi:hypothetical protein
MACTAPAVSIRLRWRRRFVGATKTCVKLRKILLVEVLPDDFYDSLSQRFLGIEIGRSDG